MNKLKDIKFKIVISVLIAFLTGILLGFFVGVEIIPQRVVSIITTCP